MTLALISTSTGAQAVSVELPKQHLLYWSREAECGELLCVRKLARAILFTF